MCHQGLARFWLTPNSLYGYEGRSRPIAAGRTTDPAEARLLAERHSGPMSAAQRTTLCRVGHNRAGRQAGVEGLIACEAAQIADQSCSSPSRRTPGARTQCDTRPTQFGGAMLAQMMDCSSELLRIGDQLKSAAK